MAEHSDKAYASREESRSWSALAAASIGLAASLCSTEIWRLPAIDSVISSSSVGQQISVVLGLALIFVYGLLSRRPWSESPWFAATLCVILSLDIFLSSVFEINNTFTSFLHYASFGIGFILLALWAELLYKHFPGFAIDAFIGALLVASVLQVTLGLLISPVIRVASAIIPLLSAVCYVIYLHSQNSRPAIPTSRPADSGKESAGRFLTRMSIPEVLFLAAALLCYNILFRFMHSVWLPYQSTEWSGVAIQSLSAAGALIAGLTALIFRSQMKTRLGLFLARAAIIVFSFLALFLSASASEAYSSLIYLAPFNAAHKTIYLLIFCVCGFATESRRGRMMLFAGLFFAYRIPSLMGVFALVLPFIDPEAYPSMSLAAVAAIIALSEFFYVAYTLLIKQKPGNAGIRGMVTEEAAVPAPAEKAPATETAALPGESFRTRISRVLQERYGLTQREIELIPLLEDGANAEAVSQELFISKATAKTHIHNIYAKLGVHSRDELIKTLSDIRQSLSADSPTNS